VLCFLSLVDAEYLFLQGGRGGGRGGFGGRGRGRGGGGARTGGIAQFEGKKVTFD
jgi:nucleolin